MTLATWLGFFLAAILISVTPGPGAVLSMSNGMRRGYWVALRGILGLQAAILMHLLIVALGLGALLATSETAFALLKFVGAAYLVWLGWQRWRAPLVAADAQVSREKGRSYFLQGMLVNLTNPKAIIFIAALVPQFIDPGLPQVPQYSIVASTLCLTDLAVMSAYALAAVRLGRWLHAPTTLKAQNQLIGGLFMAAGGFLAISSRSV